MNVNANMYTQIYALKPIKHLFMLSPIPPQNAFRLINNNLRQFAIMSRFYVSRIYTLCPRRQPPSVCTRRHGGGVFCLDHYHQTKRLCSHLVSRLRPVFCFVLAREQPAHICIQIGQEGVALGFAHTSIYFVFVWVLSALH